MHQVITQAQGGSKAIGDIEVALMKESQVPLRCMIQSRCTHIHIHGYASSLLYSLGSCSLGNHFRHTLFHHLLCHHIEHRIIHLLLDSIADRLGHTLIEEDRSIGLQPLIREEATSGPIPETAHSAITLQGKFLGQRVLKLLLQDAHIIGRKIILIHTHLILQILIACGRSKAIISSCMVHGNTRDKGMTQISSVKGGGRKRSLACLQIQLAIRETILVNILIVGEKIYVPASVELCLQHNLSSSLIILVGSVAGIRISEESLLCIIEGCYRKRQMVIDTMIMSQLYIAIISGTITQLQISTLILKRIARIDTHQSTLCVLAIESSLRTTQDINTGSLIMMKIEGRLAHHRNAIQIDAYRRTVYSAANATHIHCTGKTTAIVRHYKIRDITRKLSQIAGAQFLYLKSTNRSTAE